jgi:hypothetical protein
MAKQPRDRVHGRAYYKDVMFDNSPCDERVPYGLRPHRRLGVPEVCPAPAFDTYERSNSAGALTVQQSKAQCSEAQQRRKRSKVKRSGMA